MSDIPVVDEGGIQWRPNVCVATEAAAQCADCHPIPTPEGTTPLYWCKGTCPEAEARCSALQGTPVAAARSPYYNIWVIVIVAILLGLFFLIIGLLFGSLIRWGGSKEQAKAAGVPSNPFVPPAGCPSSFSCYPDPVSPTSVQAQVTRNPHAPSDSTARCPPSQSNTFFQLPGTGSGPLPYAATRVEVPITPYQSVPSEANGPFSGSQVYISQPPSPSPAAQPYGEWVFRRY